MKKVLVLMVVALMIAACGPDQSHYTITTPTALAAWLPSGFRAAGDGLGARWLDDNEFECTYSSGHCWGLEVITRDGCQDLYAEITILDSSNANIGWTNDTASGVMPMERVRLIFDSFEAGARAARLSELNCH